MAMPPGFGDKMQVDEAASELSSSPMSSPPTSPQNNGFSDTIRVARPQFSNLDVGGGGVAVGQPSATSAHAQTTPHANNAIAPTTNASAPEKPKRQRKKKVLGPDGKPVDDGKPKEKKPRKPREPKDKTATNGQSTAAPRKRIKTEDKAAQDAATTSRQPTITEMVNNYSSPIPTGAMPSQPSKLYNNSIRNSLPPQVSNTPTARPFSSGQNYDPIRSTTIESVPARQTSASKPVTSALPSPHINRASASPSIASLIDPPAWTKTSAPPTTHSPQITMQSLITPHPMSPTPAQAAPKTLAPPPLPSKAQTSPLTATSKPVDLSTLDGAMDIDPSCSKPKAAPKGKATEAKVSKAPSKSSSSAPTPKAAKPTPPPAPKGTGSGLLSSSHLFGGPSTSETTERRGVDIDIQISLNPFGGNTINIAQEIVKKYGRDAINPRAAAHRERLLQIQAAANKIDGGSADDMSVDLMSEPDIDSNVEMGGMEENKSAGDDKPVRKRRKKVEEYDKEDDFIDDTELAWQEQAAVAKDGFFVYSGPLIPAGETANVESSAPSTRGRGRGRGRGSRAAAGTTHASLAEKKDPNAPATTGRGRGRGRGTGAPRKPRITKADRERMEIEKLDRERTAANIGGPSGGALAFASGNTASSLGPKAPLGTTV